MSFIQTGALVPNGITIAGNTLYTLSYYPLAEGGGFVVGEYNATTGAPINPALITGTMLGANGHLTVNGNDLFVSFYYAGVVSEYNAATGAQLIRSFLPA